MKVIVFLVAFLALFAVAFSAQALYGKNPTKPGHCWTDLSGPLRDGEQKNIQGQCSQVSCAKDGTAVLTTCGVAVGPDGIRLPTDYSKPYPKCCPGN